MVEVLATVIKPAAPKAKTVDMILGNAKNWGYTSMVILQDHYEEALDEALKDLTPDPSLRWKEVFEVATRWAIKNLPRLPREVVDHAEALVAAALEPMPQDRQTNTGGLTDEPEQPTLGRQTQEEVESLEEVVVPPGRGKQTQGPPRTRDGSSQVDPQDGPPAPQMTAAVPLDRGQETTIRTDQQTQTGVITRGKGRQNRQEHPEIKELEDGEHVAPPVLPEPPKERRGNRGRQTVSEPRAEGGQPAGDVSLAGPPPREITRQTQVPLGPIEDDPFAAYPWEKVRDAVGMMVFQGANQGLGPSLPLFTPGKCVDTPRRRIRINRKSLDWTQSVTNSHKRVKGGNTNLTEKQDINITEKQKGNQ
ncbi:hypothetical protein GBF38_004844 [Nibea albiflora]|uniref:Uncharacterized protein n=1 Tax=Nibea albiflora TaxID=240163 RepID=A0ACB7EGR1_NIBAL|nr:hypothetical protein GBF38_004844 [Nibea albiflora]